MQPSKAYVIAKKLKDRSVAEAITADIRSGSKAITASTTLGEQVRRLVSVVGIFRLTP